MCKLAEKGSYVQHFASVYLQTKKHCMTINTTWNKVFHVIINNKQYELAKSALVNILEIVSSVKSWTTNMQNKFDCFVLSITRISWYLVLFIKISLFCQFSYIRLVWPLSDNIQPVHARSKHKKSWRIMHTKC